MSCFFSWWFSFYSHHKMSLNETVCKNKTNLMFRDLLLIVNIYWNTSYEIKFILTKKSPECYSQINFKRTGPFRKSPIIWYIPRNNCMTLMELYSQSESILLNTHMERHLPVGLLSWLWDDIECTHALYGYHVHSECTLFCLKNP